jgi:hypothetical protein
LRRIAALVLALSFTGAPALAAGPNLYEWLATAPVVVAGEHLETNGKHADFRVVETLRGELAADSVIRVNVRRANRDRDRLLDPERLRFDAERSYVLLLTPATKQKAEAPPTFELIRGSRGARQIPLEGGAVLLDALREFVGIQERKDDGHTWRELDRMLEGTNPLALETALAMFLKFGRGRQAQLGSLRPLLEHPSETTRESVALLIGQILARREEGALDDRELLQSELVSRARRDGAVGVRVAALEALHRLGGPQTTRILEEIAREDPDQHVRYAAEKLLYQLRPREEPAD